MGKAPHELPALLNPAAARTCQPCRPCFWWEHAQLHPAVSPGALLPGLPGACWGPTALVPMLWQYFLCSMRKGECEGSRAQLVRVAGLGEPADCAPFPIRSWAESSGLIQAAMHREGGFCEHGSAKRACSGRAWRPTNCPLGSCAGLQTKQAYKVICKGSHVRRVAGNRSSGDEFLAAAAVAPALLQQLPCSGRTEGRTRACRETMRWDSSASPGKGE